MYRLKRASTCSSYQIKVFVVGYDTDLDQNEYGNVPQLMIDNSSEVLTRPNSIDPMRYAMI